MVVVVTVIVSVVVTVIVPVLVGVGVWVGSVVLVSVCVPSVTVISIDGVGETWAYAVGIPSARISGFT